MKRAAFIIVATLFGSWLWFQVTGAMGLHHVSPTLDNVAFVGGPIIILGLSWFFSKKIIKP